jgi:hypothetical protein
VGIFFKDTFWESSYLLATWLWVFCVFGIGNELTLSCPSLEEDKTQDSNSIWLNLFILLLVSSYCLGLTPSDLLCDVGAVGYWMVLPWLKTLSQEAKHRMTPYICAVLELHHDRACVKCGL